MLGLLRAHLPARHPRDAGHRVNRLSWRAPAPPSRRERGPIAEHGGRGPGPSQPLGTRGPPRDGPSVAGRGPDRDPVALRDPVPGHGAGRPRAPRCCRSAWRAATRSSRSRRNFAPGERGHPCRPVRLADQPGVGSPPSRRMRPASRGWAGSAHRELLHDRRPADRHCAPAGAGPGALRPAGSPGFRRVDSPPSELRLGEHRAHRRDQPVRRLAPRRPRWSRVRALRSTRPSRERRSAARPRSARTSSAGPGGAAGLPSVGWTMLATAQISSCSSGRWCCR